MANEFKKERYSGNFDGKRVSFNRIFRGRRLNDDECEALLRGEKVDVLDLVNKAGKPYSIRIQLQQKTGLSHETGEVYTFYAPDMVEFITRIPKSFCQHEFTEDEYTLLEAGKSVRCDDFISKKGKKFSATVHWGYNAERERDSFIFD